MSDSTYFILQDAPHPFIACVFCRRISYNHNDIVERYCGWCHLFHDAVAAARQLRAEGGTHECHEWPTAIQTCAVCGHSLPEPDPPAR